MGHIFKYRYDFWIPNHICIYHQNHIKLAGRLCIDCTILASVMSQRSRRNDRYVMINPLYIKPMVEPMHSCVEYSRDSARSRV
jgi:hypothetical protein